MTQDSEIIHSKGGTTFAGTDAVNTFQAFSVAMYLKLYARAKIRPNRHVSPTDLLKMATSYTKKPYRRGEYLKAAEDVTKWAREMQAALPHVVKE